LQFGRNWFGLFIKTRNRFTITRFEFKWFRWFFGIRANASSTLSAYKEKAIQAFEYGVLDFIPKPFNQSRLTKAFKRLQKSNTESNSETKFLAIQKRGRYLMIEIDYLRYIKGAGIYSELFFKDGRKEIHNKNLDKLSQLLPPNFDRIHKSYIVNSKEIEEILVNPGSKYTLVLTEDIHLPISRSKYKPLREKWGI